MVSNFRLLSDMRGGGVFSVRKLSMLYWSRSTTWNAWGTENRSDMVADWWLFVHWSHGREVGLLLGSSASHFLSFILLSDPLSTIWVKRKQSRTSTTTKKKKKKKKEERERTEEEEEEERESRYKWSSAEIIEQNGMKELKRVAGMSQWIRLKQKRFQNDCTNFFPLLRRSSHRTERNERSVSKCNQGCDFRVFPVVIFQFPVCTWRIRADLQNVCESVTQPIRD